MYEVAADHGQDVVVQLVEEIVRAVVAGIAATDRLPQQQDRRLGRTKGDECAEGEGCAEAEGAGGFEIPSLTSVALMVAVRYSPLAHS